MKLKSGMKRFTQMPGKECAFFISTILLCVSSLFPNVWSQEKYEKPGVIVTTDGEKDDRCSMVRFLLYASEWDIEGIIYSSSKFHWKGHTWAGEQWIEEMIDQYAQVVDNLRQHHPDYPSPQELKSKVYVGNISRKNDMDKDTPGSDRIVEVLLDSDPRPVYLQAWGGTNTIARALWKIHHEYPEQMEKVSRKAIIYIILNQDDTFRFYIQLYWPDIQVLFSDRQFRTIGYKWSWLIPPKFIDYFSPKWMKQHITAGHGPLCSAYPVKDFLSEGDSPSFMHQIPVGLRSLEHPAYGGWGGRFVKEEGSKNIWIDARDDGNWAKPIWRWAAAFQNDWAARADWCVQPYNKANHPPVVKLAHPLNLQASVNEKVILNAKGTIDPDGDELSYRWWQYKEPGTYNGIVKIQQAENQQAYFYVPAAARAHQKVHIICEVTDNGNPPLTGYQRVLVEFLENSK